MLGRSREGLGDTGGQSHYPVDPRCRACGRVADLAALENLD